MHGAGKGSSPPEFRLEGFEKDPEGVKEAVARSGYKAGGYNNPAIEKGVSLWSIHLGWQKNAIRGDQRESRIFFVLAWEIIRVSAPLFFLTHNSNIPLFHLSLARASSSIGLAHGIRVVIGNSQG
jgi:hypothetical protein